VPGRCIRSELAKWAKVIKDAGVKPEQRLFQGRFFRTLIKVKSTNGQEG